MTSDLKVRSTSTRFIQPALIIISLPFQSLQAILASSLKRAIRDNDLVYIQAIPPTSQLARITPASMVKAVVPPSVDNSLDWLMHEGGGALFSGLVPYGVHLALSEYKVFYTALFARLLEDDP